MTFVLDESGSMSAAYEATISGFNEFMDSQRDKSLGVCRVSLVKFNGDRIKTVYSDRHIDDVKPLTRRTYNPASVTPLYDAIGQAIRDTEEKYKASVDVLKAVTGSDGKAAIPMVIMIIMTDGLENNSRKYNQKTIFDLISEKKDEGWAFVFLGADQDSWAAAQPLGFGTGNIANYDRNQTQRAFAGVAQATTQYRMATSAVMDNLAASVSQNSDDADVQQLVSKASADLADLRKNFWQGKKAV
jgi:hypothetical protein